MRVVLGGWKPDLDPLLVGSKGLVTCQNVTPTLYHYGPHGSLASLSLGATTAYCRGSISGVSSEGVPFSIAGDETKLYKVDPGTSTHVDISKSGGYSLSPTHRWQFAQFDDDVISVAPGHAIQSYNVRSSSLFEDLSISAPRAKCIGVVGQHVVVGNTVDLQDAAVPTRIAWPAIGNPYGWPQPGSVEAFAVLSDYRTLKGDSGDVQAIVAANDVGAIFQESSVSRMDFIGGQAMYSIREVEEDYGLLIPNAYVAFGAQVFYLSEAGWRLFTYSGSEDVGEGKINRTFLADLDQDYAHRVSATRDPDQPLLYVAYPGSGNSGGVPNRVLVFNFLSRRFALLDMELELIFSGTALVDASIDQADAEDVDSATGSFDDRLAAYGAGSLRAYNSSHAICDFSGAALSALWETGDIEFNPDRRSMTGPMRPLVTGGHARIQVGGRGNHQEDIRYNAAYPTSLRTGVCPSRMDARYHRLRMTVEGGFEKALGIDAHARPTGRM